MSERPTFVPIAPGAVAPGDVVIRQRDFENAEDVSAGDVLGKLGELGLPISLVKDFNAREPDVALLDYDSETQPRLQRSRWTDFIDHLERSGASGVQRGLAVNSLIRINRYGIGEGGRFVRDIRHARVPILYQESTGEPYPGFGLKYREEDKRGTLLDVDALDSYVRHGDIHAVRGVGPATETILIGFVNSRIAELPDA